MSGFSRCIIILTLLLLLSQGDLASAATVQITVFCGGSAVYDNAVAVPEGSSAFDAIKASGVAYTGYDSGWGFFITSIAGCGGSWGPAFYVNGAESGLGVSDYQIEDGDQLQFIGPNNDGPTAGFLYLAEVPSVVQKGEGFRIKVMEKSAYTYGGYDRPSVGATVIVGNESFETGGDGYTYEITKYQDAYFCVAAEKEGYIPTYWNFIYEISYIQCGAGGPYICAIAGGRRRGNIYYDETSSIKGHGFSFVRCNFENLGRFTKVYQKGSGDYNVEKIVKQRPSKININESTEMGYNPTTFKAYDRPLSYSSKYEDSLSQKRYDTGSIYKETFSQLDYIRREGVYNNSDKIRFSMQAVFNGSADLYSRALNEDAYMAGGKKAEPNEEFYEAYIGSFQIFRRGEVPLLNSTSDKDDCEATCRDNCTETCEKQPVDCDYYCEEYCADYCENKSSEYEEYEALPCCTGGWNSMTAGDQIGYSAKGIFDCSCTRSSGA